MPTHEIQLSGPRSRLGRGIKSISEELHSVYQMVYWRFNTGAIVDVKWPGPSVTYGSFTFGTNDPNEHYRPWLEENVGKQGRDWDWTNWSGTENFEIRIVVSKRKASLAPMIALMWS
jgi:hypothetical protein